MPQCNTSSRTCRGRPCRAPRGRRAVRPARALNDAGAYPRAEAPAVRQSPYVNPERVTQAIASETRGSGGQAVAPSTPQKVGNAAIFGIAAFFVVTGVVSMVNYSKKYNSEDATKRRSTLKNAALIKELTQYLPDDREGLSQPRLWKLRIATGFSYPEMFRKYLWYVLRDRKFDDVAVADLAFLRDRMKLPNEQLAEALYERCVRIERKYGNLMLQTDGLTQAAVQKKAACRALFSKLLYLVENEDFLAPNDTLNVDVLRNVIQWIEDGPGVQLFGATEDDLAELRIVSLHEIDMDKLNDLADGR